MTLRGDASRYGRGAVALHWAIAAALALAIASGFAASSGLRPALAVHLGAGLLAGGLGIVRVAWWVMVERKPDVPAGAGPVAAGAARLVHLGLTIVPLGMLASGIGMAALSGVVGALAAGTPLPQFEALPPRAAHGVGARILLALIALHLGAVLWHVLRRHRPFARMGWG